MPHNNRMSTSASLKTHAIWQTAIGHDPYANQAETKDAVTDADKEKAKSVMEMARSQNLTDGAERSGFTAQMYRGLKQGKKRKADGEPGANDGVDPQLKQLLDDPSSSSEEEFVEVSEPKKETKKKRSSSIKKKEHKRSRKHSSSSDSDDSSDEERARRKRRKGRKKKKHKRGSRDHSDSDTDNSEIDRRRRKHKRKER
jgi:hypothetical protein